MRTVQRCCTRLSQPPSGSMSPISGIVGTARERCCVSGRTRNTLNAPSRWRALLWRPDPVGSRLLQPVRYGPAAAHDGHHFKNGTRAVRERDGSGARVVRGGTEGGTNLPPPVMSTTLPAAVDGSIVVGVASPVPAAQSCCIDAVKPGDREGMRCVHGEHLVGRGVNTGG